MLTQPGMVAFIGSSELRVNYYGRSKDCSAMQNVNLPFNIS